MAELKWEVISIKDGCGNEECDWVEVDPLTGGTTTNPKITVSAATSEDDCGRATIVFSSSTNDEYSVSVVRCIPESDCENCKTKQTLSNTDGAAKTRTQIGTYEGSSSNMDITVDGIVLSNGEIGNDGKIYADISENKVGTRTGWYKILYEGVECGSKRKIIQAAIEQKCGQDTDCDVDPWYKPTTDPEHPGGTIVAEGGNVYVWISKCWDVNSAAYDNEIISEITTYEEKDTEEYAAYVIKVKTNTGNDRSFSVDFNLTNHDTQEKCDGNHIVQMTQAGGGTPPTPPTPIECNPTDNSGLNKFLNGSEGHNGFNKCIKDGLSINTSDTKCTYAVLDMVYKAATANTTTNNDTSIAWALAEMLTELTPELLSASEYGNLTKAESYFIEASTYGGVPDIITSNPTNAEDVYYRRLYGAIEYTTLRHNKFCEITEIAKKARTELTNKGVTNATLINAPKNPDGTFNFPRGSLLNPTKLAPKVTSREYPGGSTFDANSMTTVMDTMDTVDKVKHYYGDAPFLNKTFCAKRYYDIMIGHPSSGIYDNKFLTLFNNATDPQDAILNVIKRGIDGSETYQPQYRKRPTNATVSWYTTTLTCLSDCDVEKVSWAICKGQPESEYPCGDDCNQFKPGGTDNNGSYPSGHAGKSYIAGLAYLEASGINKMSDMKGFGDHRELVRAHWKSDIVVAQVVASTTIGYLNGISEFLSEMKNDFISCGDTATPTPTDCVCENVVSAYNGPSVMHDKTAESRTYIGSGKTGENCSGTLPQPTSVTIEEGTGAATTLESVEVRDEGNNIYKVYSNISENTSGSYRKTRIYFNVKEKDNEGNLYDSYLNIYQAG